MSEASLHAASEAGWGRHAAAWKRALVLLVLAWTWAAWLYRDTGGSMVQLWWTAETYTHCMLIAPISLWLAWRKRGTLLGLVPGVDARFTLPLVIIGGAWLAGELGQVNALTHLALVATMVLLVPALLGVAVSRQLLFPLGFAFFAVPIGDFLMPVMMDRTADFTVAAIRLSGVPIFREGRDFIIPSGAWSVVEACSGVRYLIASVTVGTLFAYLNYNSMMRRLAFVGASIVVPIVANWLRAYMIVMLGHLSGNKLAVGVDHLIYGWLFFGVVIMIMFAIGARWSEPELPGKAGMVAQGPRREAIRATAVAVVLAGVSVAPLIEGQLSASVAPGKVSMAPFGVVAGWGMPVATAVWRPAYESPSAESLATYERNGRKVSVFVAVYVGQTKSHRLVSSANALVRSNDPVWAAGPTGQRTVNLAGEDARVGETLLRSARGMGGASDKRLLVWHWYRVAGQTTASNHVAKALTAWSRLTGRGDAGAVVMLFSDGDGNGEAAAGMADFARQANGVIDAAIASAGGTP
ncbi:MAG: exosortase A [Burkholderiales bacterium]|nr:exosortase A [Burkholderiales bacterium]